MAINSYDAIKILRRSNCSWDVVLILAIGAILALVEAAIFLILPLFVNSESLSNINQGFILVAVIVLFARGGLFAFGQYSLSILSYRVKAKIANSSIRRIEASEDFDIDKALVPMFTTEIGHLVGYFLAPITVMYSELLVLILVSLVLAYNFGTVILYSLTVLIIIGLLYYLIVRAKLNEISEARIEYERSRSKLVVEWAALIDTIRISARDTILTKKIEKLNYVVSKYEGIQYFGLQLPKIWLEVVGIPLIVISVAATRAELSKGDLFLLLTSVGLATFRLIPSLNRLLSSLQTLKYAMPIIEKFNSIGSQVFDRSNTGVALNLDVGSKTFVIGESGSGKTTFIKKKLFANSILIKVGDEYVVPKNVSYLSQGNEIFTGTIRENITFFKDDPQHKLDLDNILRKYNLKFKIDTKHHEEQISPESISGGEKMRICLARVFENKSDLIILDEPTNGLDEYNVAAVKQILNDTTVPMIVITHDKRIADLANEIIEIG